METFQTRGWLDADTIRSIANATQLRTRNPLRLHNATIQCRGEVSGEVVKYLVVDCITSAVDGTSFKLQDEAGNLKSVSEEELEKIWVK